jgi:CBS domain-containing protein
MPCAATPRCWSRCAAVFDLPATTTAMLARFAASAILWQQPGLVEPPAGPGRQRQGRTLDLKKAGTFPLVHGIRSLALAPPDRGHHRGPHRGPGGRRQAAAKAGRRPDRQPALLHGAQAQGRPAGLDTGHPVSGGIQMEKLSSLDRDLLKDTLGVVKLFKLLLHQRFHLEAL